MLAENPAGSALAEPRVSARRRLLVLAIWSVLGAVFYVRFRGEAWLAVRSLPDLGPAIVGAVGLFVLWTVTAAIGWRVLLSAAVPEDPGRPSLARLSLIRIQAQAVNFVLPTAGLAGEGLRAVSAVGSAPLLRGSFAAIVLDNLATGVAGLVLSAAAIPLLYSAKSAPWQSGAAACLSLVLLALLAARLPFALAPRLLRRLAAGSRTARVLRIVAEQSGLRPAFRRAVAWHLVERCISVGEVYIVFLSLRVNGTVADAAVLSCVFILASFALFFIPGQLGAADLSVVVVCMALGLPASVGISVALVRRSRQIAASIGGLLLLLSARSAGGAAGAWLAGRAQGGEGGEP